MRGEWQHTTAEVVARETLQAPKEETDVSGHLIDVSVGGHNDHHGTSASHDRHHESLRRR